MNKPIAIFTALLGLGLVLPPAQGEEPSRPKVNNGNVPQGEVIIRGDNGTTFQEYSNGTEVYKVKVTPSKGRPYFLVDTDGNGSLDMVQWVLYRW